MLGVAYKKDIDDLRESPALTIIELLQKEGAEVSYNDPYFPFVGRGRKYDLQMKCTPLDNLGAVRLRADRDRSHRLRLQEDRERGEAGGGFAQRYPRHQERQDRALLGSCVTQIRNAYTDSGGMSSHAAFLRCPLDDDGRTACASISRWTARGSGFCPN